MTTQTTYHNAPIRNCETCAHYRPSSIRTDIIRGDCARFNLSTEFTIRESFCGVRTCGSELREWRQAPPPPVKIRRSLRRWLIETLWET